MSLPFSIRTSDLGLCSDPVLSKEARSCPPGGVEVVVLALGFHCDHPGPFTRSTVAGSQGAGGRGDYMTTNKNVCRSELNKSHRAGPAPSHGWCPTEGPHPAIKIGNHSYGGPINTHCCLAEQSCV